MLLYFALKMDNLSLDLLMVLKTANNHNKKVAMNNQVRSTNLWSNKTLMSQTMVL